ncbi:YjbH domain-containing protein [Vibrio europaeus]|uniref:YjbH domain-containing protein n=1 Tax=Vibrio europaeus TaxID=300876 RepID=A0AAE7DYC6_9VIBR|nr:YjbH domain-containing protein [Vibrio europaeus]QJY38872.1 YjbH domain-containing protein [Vibrio europaeus]
MNSRLSMLLHPTIAILSPIAFADSQLPHHQRTWAISQSDFGGVGLMQTPTGRMAETGEFNLGSSINSDYQHFTVSLQLMDWLETNMRYTRVPGVKYNENPDYSGSNMYTDKSIDFKLRLLNESYWIPETSIGVRDFGGSGKFDGEFIAATKRFGNLDISLGLGWGYLGQSSSITNPLCKINDYYCNRPKGYVGSGGSFDYNRWFTGPTSFFGGFEYQTPYEPLRLKVEYDGNDYSDDFPTRKTGRNPNPKQMPQHTPWNFGVNYRVSDWGDVKLSYQRGDTVTLGVNIYTNFNNAKTTWRVQPKPDVALSPSSQTKDWKQVSRELEQIAGIYNSKITTDSNILTVEGEQRLFKERTMAVDRASAVLHKYADKTVTEFRIVEKQNGLVLVETAVDRAEYVTASLYISTESNVKDSFTVQETTPKTTTRILANEKQNVRYGLEPVLKQSFGGPESFYSYSLGVDAGASAWLTDNIEIGGTIYFNIADNYDKFNFTKKDPHINNFAVPRVRTMIRAYVHDNPVRLNNLQITWFEQPHESVYTQMYTGYLEMMFAGIGGELLYRPLNSNWAVGLDANLVSQRDPHSWFGTYDSDYFFYDESKCNERTAQCQAYVLSKGTTGHLTGYYMPRWELLENTLFKLSVGKFLGGDTGARLDFSKQFDSGLTVGAYATKTNLTAKEYGEGSFNKGFYISFPLDLFTIKPSTSRAKILWEPLTRDGGQMLNRKYELFETTDSRSKWYERPNLNK